MLKKNRKKLKLILKMLFNNVRSISIKKNGDITLKRRWYSSSSNTVKTTVQDIVETVLPKSMRIISPVLALEYSDCIIDIEDRSGGLAIDTAFDHFSNFCSETNYTGRLLDKGHESVLIVRSYRRFKESWKERIDNISQFDIEGYIKSLIMSKKQPLLLSPIQALPAHSILSFKDILDNQSSNYELTMIGRCLTGDPKLDDRLSRVYRLVDHGRAC